MEKVESVNVVCVMLYINNFVVREWLFHNVGGPGQGQFVGLYFFFYQGWGTIFSDSERGRVNILFMHLWQTFLMNFIDRLFS